MMHCKAVSDALQGGVRLLLAYMQCSAVLRCDAAVALRRSSGVAYHVHMLFVRLWFLWTPFCCSPPTLDIENFSQ